MIFLGGVESVQLTVHGLICYVREKIFVHSLKVYFSPGFSYAFSSRGTHVETEGYIAKKFLNSTASLVIPASEPGSSCD